MGVGGQGPIRVVHRCLTNYLLGRAALGRPPSRPPTISLVAISLFSRENALFVRREWVVPRHARAAYRIVEHEVSGALKSQNDHERTHRIILITH
jgi:hypothetical protein